MLQNNGATYKELESAAEAKFGKVFCTLHKGVFLQLYQDMVRFNDLDDNEESSDMFSGEDGSEFSGSDFNSTMDSSGSRLDDIMNDDFL
tara:strand:+ start:321 stop:587 length:267 start_codon:yes stop_codon:yes gene_type:complete